MSQHRADDMMAGNYFDPVIPTFAQLCKLLLNKGTTPYPELIFFATELYLRLRVRFSFIGYDSRSPSPTACGSSVA